jgi:hypothetical protein
MKSLGLYTLFFVCFVAGCTCNDPKTTSETKPATKDGLTLFAAYDEGYPLTEAVVDKDAAYKTQEYLDSYQNYYEDRTEAPPFNFSVDLSNKSFQELRLLRAEILARHGFLFMDYVLRAHFNKEKWYKPVFWYENFKIKLSDEEQQFIEKVLTRERALYAQNYLTENGATRANMSNLVNGEQFPNLPAAMTQHLKQDGFVINKGQYEQLFHVYDENYYDYTPSFITTDLYLQVLHIHLSKQMQALEKEKMIPLVRALLQEQYKAAQKTAASAQTPLAKSAAAWNQVYYAVALSLMTGKTQAVPPQLKSYYDYEYRSATDGQGRSSDFLGDSLMDYTQFQPRGNYTRNDSLKRYFKCVKWLNSAAIYLDEDERLSSAILMADALQKAPLSAKNYGIFCNIIGFLAGEENNLSFAHLFAVLKKMSYKDAESLLTRENIEKIRAALYAADPKKMRPKGANAVTNAFLERKKLVFTAGRYTFDGDILQRLVHIEREHLNEPPKRPFPKALDVFAAMGNGTAEHILLQDYKENQAWPQYGDTLNLLKKELKGFQKWDISVYNKTMETVLALQKPDANAPYFMRLPNWAKKDLNTMLAAWTGLKHDMVLYIDQPSAAEMGDGGELPPPQKIAYVEPRTGFWTKCLELLRLNKKMLEDNSLMTPALADQNKELQDIAALFLRISHKELAGEKLTNAEFDTLSFIGGQIERLTLNIIESEELMMSEVNTPDRYIAIATDVYTYNKDCLQEAVGAGDEIYIIAEINGLLYLTRGAVFSHYEFKQSTEARLTDEAWQEQVLKRREPPAAIWMKDVKISVERPKTAAHFNLY